MKQQYELMSSLKLVNKSKITVFILLVNVPFFDMEYLLYFCIMHAPVTSQSVLYKSENSAFCVFLFVTLPRQLMSSFLPTRC